MSAVLNLPAKPAMVAPEPGAALPGCLTERAHWVCWTYEYRPPKWTKVPRQPNGVAAKSDTPATWSTFAEVLAAADQRPDMGVGFVFSPDDPFVGIDMDGA
jgi:putative DNA primase/helicase